MDATHRWHSLPESVKSRILDANRYWNVEYHEWWGDVYDGFKEDMAKVGICVEQMYFRGFWNQGDGACFEGRVCDWPLFLASLGITDSALIKHLDQNGVFASRHYGRYYHEHCTRFDVEFNLPESDDDSWWIDRYGTGEELRDAVLLAALNKYSHGSLEEQFTEAFKDHMRDLYRRLEEEYDHLTSDEAVLEALEANDQLDDLIAEHTEELECEDE